jgi:hypothetical protein
MDLEKGISMVKSGRGECDGNDGNIHPFFLSTEKKMSSLQL